MIKTAKETVHNYMDNIISGAIPACKWVKLAVLRHIKDLEDGENRGLFFDEKAANHVIKFFAFLKHSKGEWAGQVLTLSPWQMFHLWVVFGWKKADGTRRFRTSYLEVARKNGKTTFLAGVGLYLLDADGEPGAEIYSAATKRDQARISHSEATRMVKSSPLLLKRIKPCKDNLHVEATSSKFEPLGRDSDSTDGLNIHGAIVDELHAHKTRDLWEVIETATGARRQPLISAITTAGFDRKSICWEQHEYTRKILDGIIEDDSFHGLIFCLDEGDGKEDKGDDWEDETLWVKANPNIGISAKLDDLQRKKLKAKETPAALNGFLRLHMNKWTQAESRWLSIEDWRKCSRMVNADGLRGRRCYGGLDLSSTTDISALIKVFPPEYDDELYQILCRFWIPDDAIRLRSRRDRVPYDAWVRQGLITATPGNVIDYDFIEAQIEEDANIYDIQEIGYDPYNATQIVQNLQKNNFPMVPIRQGFSMNACTKETERLILSGRFAHGGNPVLTWMADNVIIYQDAKGNIRPDKEKSLEKIDGIVALIMAIDRVSRHTDDSSVYESRGVIAL